MRALIWLRNGLLVLNLIALLAVSLLAWFTLERLKELNQEFAALVEQVSLPGSAQVTTIYARDYDPQTGQGTVLAKLYTQNRIYATIDQIPPLVKDVVLAVEDAKFYSHPGMDLKAMVRAFIINLRRGRITQGASTITMQLARNVFLPGRKYEKSYERKLMEVLLAAAIERRYTKDEILERYLNYIFFGQQSYGIRTAAQTYFGKDLDELTLAEVALLAGLPQRPSLYNPFKNPHLALKRRNQVLDRLLSEYERYQRGESELDLSYLTLQMIEAAKQAPLGVVEKPPPSGAYYRAPYFVDYVRQKLIDLYGEEMVYNQGLTVVTTLDPRYQEIAERVLEENISKVEKKRNVHQGALIAIDNRTGAILAMVGGRDWKKSKFNRAVQIRRQPGSGFKPFLYTTALKFGWRLDDWLVDSDKEKYVDALGREWQPKNADWKYDGMVPLAWAMIKSKNAASAWLINQIGPENVVQTARDFGITSPLTPVLSLALGTEGVSPLEMARAFATFANLGQFRQVYAIDKVYDRTGLLIDDFGLKNRATVRQVVDPEIAAQMLAVMQGVVNFGTGTRARLPGRPAAGKTGTTDDYRDAWFTGFTPQITSSVWVGNDDYSQMKRMFGGETPAQIWHDFMAEVHKDLPVEEFSLPPSGRRYQVPPWETRPDPNLEEESKGLETTLPGEQEAPLLPTQPDMEVYF